MKKTALTMLLIILTGLPAGAAELKLKLPSGTRDAVLLSAGTQAVLDHLHAGLDGKLAELDRRFGISALEQQQAGLEQTIAATTTQRKDRIHDIREEYLAKLDVKVLSARTEVSLESSSMGQIYFTYAITNRSDRTLAYLHYDPVVGDINIPTSSRLILELIDFESMLFGLAPGGTLSNAETAPEEFPFFAAELTQDQIDFLRKNINKQLKLHVSDLTFVKRVDYKGQVRELTLEQAFAGDLKKYDKRIADAEADLQTCRQKLEKARAGHAAEKKVLEEIFSRESSQLMEAALRQKSASAKNDTYVFEDLAPGDYIVYARAAGDKAVFEKITLSGEGRTSINLSATRKDPFSP